MANSLYMSGRQGFLDGSIDFDTNTIRLTLINRDGGGSLNNVTDITFYTQVGDTARVKTYDAALAATGIGGKTVTSGVADGFDCTLSATSGQPVGAIILWADSGSPSTSRLIGWIDTGTGLPASPNGGDITVQWSAGASRIFML